jgi:anti-anti-sigma regulatory factor
VLTDEDEHYVLIEQCDEGLAFCVHGPLSVRAAELLIEVVDHEDPRADLAIDLTQTTFPDARALRHLIDDVDERRRAGRNIRVRGSCVQIERLRNGPTGTL